MGNCTVYIIVIVVMLINSVSTSIATLKLIFDLLKVHHSDDIQYARSMQPPY